MSLKGLECPVSKLVNSDTCPRRTPQDWPQIAEARERRAGSLRFGVDTVMEITPRSEADAAHFFADPQVGRGAGPHNDYIVHGIMIMLCHPRHLMRVDSRNEGLVKLCE